MAVETREEALAFVDAMRLTIQGKVGFRWMTERLSELTSYLDALADENGRLNAFIEQSGAREAYDAFSATVGEEAAAPLDADDSLPSNE